MLQMKPIVSVCRTVKNVRKIVHEFVKTLVVTASKLGNSVQENIISQH